MRVIYCLLIIVCLLVASPAASQLTHLTDCQASANANVGQTCTELDTGRVYTCVEKNGGCSGSGWRANTTDLIAVATMVDATATTAVYTPAAATCIPIADGTEADDAVIFKTAAASYQYTFDAAAADNDGFDCDITGVVAQGTVSFGFWFRSDTTFDAGDLDLSLDDAGAEANEDFPAYATANVWAWVEIDVTADCAASCDDIDGIFVQATAAAPTTFNDTVINIDQGGLWLTTAEEALGVAIPEDGIRSFSSASITDVNDNTTTVLTEWTDYFPHYETGNDFIIVVTDQSANYGLALVAY